MKNFDASDRPSVVERRSTPGYVLRSHIQGPFERDPKLMARDRAPDVNVLVCWDFCKTTIQHIKQSFLRVPCKINGISTEIDVHALFDGVALVTNWDQLVRT